MKKSLVALAVLGAFAGTAQAQVTLYGLVDTGVVIADDGENRYRGLDSGIGGASRWGIRGSEDLGGGTKAHFVLESGFDSSTGSGSNTFSRLAYLGLDTGLGTVRLGRQDTAMKDLFGKIDPFGAAGIANAHDYFLNTGNYTLFDTDGELTDARSIDQRRSNQLTYLTPDFGGFNGGLYYNFGEEYGDSTDGQIYGVRLGFDTGPFSIQAAHENINVGVGPDRDRKDSILGATVDFNVAKLHAAYGNRSDDAVGDARSAMVGVSAPLGNGKVMANYIRVENREVDNADSNAIALGYNYSFSKRTSLIARYVRTDNDSGAGLAIADGDYGLAATGQNANAIGLGIQHRF